MLRKIRIAGIGGINSSCNNRSGHKSLSFIFSILKRKGTFCVSLEHRCSDIIITVAQPFIN